jgi:hypothetical protein
MIIIKSWSQVSLRLSRSYRRRSLGYRTLASLSQDAILRLRPGTFLSPFPSSFLCLHLCLPSFPSSSYTVVAATRAASAWIIVG